MSFFGLKQPCLRFVGQIIVHHKLFVISVDSNNQEYVVEDGHRVVLFKVSCETFKWADLEVFCTIFMMGVEYLQVRINKAVQESFR